MPANGAVTGGRTVTANIARWGFWSGMAAFVATVAYDVVQILQVLGVLGFPADEILIYGTALCIVAPFILEMLALHHTTRGEKRFWTHAALVFTVIYAVFVTANYVVQLATVIPAEVRGTAEGVALLTQTPHSLFWDFDAVGYIAMALAALLAVPAVENVGFERWVRVSLLVHALVTPLIMVVYFYPTYSEGLLMLGLPWAFTAPLFMAMLAVMLRRRGTSAG
jgi:hypothetical protein